MEMLMHQDLLAVHLQLQEELVVKKLDLRDVLEKVVAAADIAQDCAVCEEELLTLDLLVA